MSVMVFVGRFDREKTLDALYGMIISGGGIVIAGMSRILAFTSFPAFQMPAPHCLGIFQYAASRHLLLATLLSTQRPTLGCHN
jgi:hypothetical protein